jgi:hypothetical protein
MYVVVRLLERCDWPGGEAVADEAERANAMCSANDGAWLPVLNIVID